MEDFFANHPILDLVGTATLETIFMVFLSTIFALLLGFPLGVLLNSTGKHGITPKPILNMALNRIVDVFRSFPFVILMIVLIPLTRKIMGSAVGTAAMIIPLSIAALPFVARVTESALTEVNPEMIVVARAMGSTNWQIVTKVLIPESLPSVAQGITLTIITLVGYSAMAGTLGGGGLGDLALRYGYQRFRGDVMAASVAVIVVLVATLQFAGTRISNAMLARR